MLFSLALYFASEILEICYINSWAELALLFSWRPHREARATRTSQQEHGQEDQQRFGVEGVRLGRDKRRWQQEVHLTIQKQSVAKCLTPRSDRLHRVKWVPLVSVMRAAADAASSVFLKRTLVLSIGSMSEFGSDVLSVTMFYNTVVFYERNSI